MESEASKASVPEPPVTVPEDSSDPAEAKDLRKQEIEAMEAITKFEGSQKDCSLELFDLQKQRNFFFLNYLQELRALEIHYSKQYTVLYEERKKQLDRHGEASGFWLKVLQNDLVTSDFLFGKDAELLLYLVDIRLTEEEKNQDFALEFEFAENPFISDKVLTKKFIHDGNGDLRRAEGCEIHWKGENFTEKKIKKKKSKKGKTQTTIKTVTNSSFFSFFKTKSEEDNIGEEADEEEEFIPLTNLDEDDDLGTEIRDEIVPNALLYFLGVRRKPEEEESEGEDGGEENPGKPKKTVDASGHQKEECKPQ